MSKRCNAECDQPKQESGLTDLREKVAALLGPDFGATRFVAAQSDAAGDMIFTTEEGEVIPATYLPPRDPETPAPAILYCHAHGARYHIGRRELREGRPALTAPYAGVLQDAGYAVLCLEMPCFGTRADIEENATAKARLWQGRTLFGQMLGEQRAGLDWLMAQPGVDSARVGVMGISMGGTLAWWLAALDPRLAACVSMACFADMAGLIATGAHDIHGNYMTVPGLLALCRTGEVSALTAPRPLLHCVGLQDPGTPESAFATARDDVLAAYARNHAETALSFFVDRELGHAETPQMREYVLENLNRVLF